MKRVSRWSEENLRMVVVDITKTLTGIQTWRGVEHRSFRSRKPLLNIRKVWIPDGERDPFRRLGSEFLVPSSSLGGESLTVGRNSCLTTYPRFRRPEETNKEDHILEVGYLFDPVTTISGVTKVTRYGLHLGDEIPTLDPPATLRDWRVGVTDL